MNTRKRGFGVVAGALLSLALILPGTAVAKPAGHLWTANADCGPQKNANAYVGGDFVWLRGDGFDVDAALHWSIAGLEGGASADPGTSVASGDASTDGSGSFCFAAYQVAADDLGEYKATVEVAGVSKSDNYRVTGGATDPGSDPGAGGTGGNDGAGETSDTGAGSDSGAGSDTGAGTDTGAGSDTGAGTDTAAGTDPGAGSDAGTDTGAGSDTASNAGDAGSTAGGDSSAGADDQSTQQVLGATSHPATGDDEDLAAEVSGGTPEMPATDTVVSRDGQSGFGFVILGLASLVAAAVIFAPARRRDVRA